MLPHAPAGVAGGLRGRYDVAIPFNREDQACRHGSCVSVGLVTTIVWLSTAVAEPPAPPAKGLPEPTITVEAPPALVEREGKLAQFVEVKIGNIQVGPYDCSAGLTSKAGQVQLEAKIRGEGDTPDMTVHIDAPGLDGAETSERINAADIRALLRPVETETTANVEIKAAGKTLVRRKIKLEPVRKFVFYLLPHSHNDIGYTHLQPEVERKQWTTYGGHAAGPQDGRLSSGRTVQMERRGDVGGG